jgi:hypothetical protein
MLNIDLIINNNVNFINKFTEYENLKITINKKLKSLKTKLFNIRYSKQILFKSLIPNSNRSKKIFKNYFPYLYNEKKKIKKKIEKYAKEKYAYKKYDINEYNNFINSIQNKIFSNTIIQNLCDTTCPICLDTKITCMVKIIDNEHSIGKNNKIINMSNCKGTIICYKCCIDMYNNRNKYYNKDVYNCILCNKKMYFDKNIPPFNISYSHTKIIDNILENEYYIYENKYNIKLPLLIIYDNIKFKYLKDLNLYLVNKIVLEYNYMDYDSDSSSEESIVIID